MSPSLQLPQPPKLLASAPRPPQHTIQLVPRTRCIAHTFAASHESGGTQIALFLNCDVKVAKRHDTDTMGLVCSRFRGFREGAFQRNAWWGGGGGGGRGGRGFLAGWGRERGERTLLQQLQQSSSFVAAVAASSSLERLELGRVVNTRRCSNRR